MDDGLEEKLDRIEASMGTRFTLLERENAGLRDWMERLTNSVERLSDTASNFLAAQQRIISVEQSVSDLALDVDGLDGRMSDIEKHDQVREWRWKGAFAIVAAAVGALVTGIVGKFTGLF